MPRVKILYEFMFARRVNFSALSGRLAPGIVENSKFFN